MSILHRSPVPTRLGALAVLSALTLSGLSVGTAHAVSDPSSSRPAQSSSPTADPTPTATPSPTPTCESEKAKAAAATAEVERLEAEYAQAAKKVKKLKRRYYEGARPLKKAKKLRNAIGRDLDAATEEEENAMLSASELCQGQ